MEFRKLIRFGKNSYVISIPKPWVEKNKLKKGDTIYINENLDGLQINVREKKKISEQIRAIIINTKAKALNQIQTEKYNTGRGKKLRTFSPIYIYKKK